MTVQPHGQLLDRQSQGGLADVVELILDKGLVVDASARVSVIGIEILAIEARVVVASIDTYLRYAEEMRRLQLTPQPAAGLPELVEGVTAGIAAGKTRGVIEAVTGRMTRRRRGGR